MIPSLNLDNQNVKDIFEAMLARMPQYYDSEMDVSYQEPGVALLELFCLLKDMQQFYLNFVSDNHKINYIKLLGGCRVSAAPAETTLVFTGTGTLPKGLAAFAGDIRFETAEEIRLSENRICAAASGRDGSVTGIPIWTSGFYPFGQDMRDGHSLYIGFKHDIRRHPVHGVYFELESPMPDLAVPLGEMRISFFSSRGKWEILYFDDETNCFSVSGKIHFTILREMDLLTIGGLECYWIRITLIKNYFEMPPRLLGVYLNAVSARQTRSIAASREYILDSGKTLKLETFLEQSGRLELQKTTDGRFSAFDAYTRTAPETIQLLESHPDESFLILAWDKDSDIMLGELNGTPNQRVSYPDAAGIQRLQIRQAGKPVWEIWNRCEDLLAAGPLEKCFSVDGETLCFGNNENGAIPPAGAVRVIDCAAIGGAKGNVRKGVIDSCPGHAAQVVNVKPAAGGHDVPTVEEVLRDARKNLDSPGRAVTLEDYRKIILNMPQLAVEQVKAICDDSIINLYVRPKSFRRLPKLNGAYKENIRAYIEPFRILTTQVDIRSPEYFGVIVYANLVVEATAHEVVEQVTRAVHSILPGEANTFFDSLSHGALYGLIHSLPFVKRIDRLWFECGGHTVKSGFYRVKPGGILYLEDIKVCM